MATSPVPPGPRRSPAGRQPASAPDPEQPSGKPGPLQVEDLLAGRYRLLELLPSSPAAAVWRARDEVLARAVAVRCVPTPNNAARDAAQPFLDAAARLARVNHPGVARVYDAALEPRPGRGNDVAYVISEWVEGERLDRHLGRVGALAAPDAADVVRQAADALTAVHAGGLAHGRVHPGNVMITPSGRVRVVDAAVATALHDLDDLDGRRDAHDLPADVGVTPSGIAADTRDLAAVLYALTTCRWPASATPQPGGSLAPAPTEGQHPLTIRQLRAAVPRALDNAVTRGLEPQRMPALGPLRTPAAFADATDASVADLRAEQLARETDETSPPGRIRKGLPWVAAAAFVTAVGVIGWVFGLAVGDLPPRSGSVDAIVSSPEPAKPRAATFPAIVLRPTQVRDYDPLGDNQENPDQVPNAVDGDPTTSWSTDHYRSAALSGLKPGVGLLIDLGTSRPLHTVTVSFSAPGAHVEARVSNTQPTGADTLRTVAVDANGDQVATLKPPAGTTARWVLVWITQLPPVGDRFFIGVSELRLT